MNATIGPLTEGREVLQGLADCTVRDLATSRVLKALGIGHRRVPDAVFGAPFATSARRDFSDHLVVTDCHPSRRI